MNHCRTKWSGCQKNDPLPIFLTDSALLCTKTSFDHKTWRLFFWQLAHSVLQRFECQTIFNIKYHENSIEYRKGCKEREKSSNGELQQFFERKGVSSQFFLNCFFVEKKKKLWQQVFTSIL